MRFRVFSRRARLRGEEPTDLASALAAIGNRNQLPRVLLGESGTIRYANAAAGALLGHDAQALTRIDAFSFIHPNDEARAKADLAAFLSGRVTCPSPEYAVRRGDGSWAHVSVDAMNLLDVRGVGGVLLTGRDVTAARAQEQYLLDLALLDPITGIGNRRTLLCHLAQVMTDDRPAVVVFIDVDHFRRVNDSLGHTAGDEVLAAMAARLEAASSATAAVHHFSADTFVVTIAGLARDRAIEMAWELLAELGRPLYVAGAELRLMATAGVAVREPGATPASILRDADSALTRAKLQRRGGVGVFSASMRADVVQRLSIETDLRRALERDELAVHLQPIVKIATREVVASEALVRWERPEGYISPELFVPIAEDAGLVGALGERVLSRAIDLLRSGNGPRISVNLSPRQLFDPRLPGHVERLLSIHGVNPGRLAFEMTETVVVENYSLAAQCIASLRGLGCPVGLDDFGTGYSSLGNLRRLPVDFLKIDRTLVADTDVDVQAVRIVQAIVSLAGALGLCTVAEGIERERQLDAVAEAGVDLGQGWLFGHPRAPTPMEPA
jgi:diguanylate cyclase (GGDEF)-like protein/PAS domain S-box-containing protein